MTENGKGTENCWYARINRNDENQYDDYRGMVPLEVFLYAEKSAEYEQIKDETLIQLGSGCFEERN